MKFPTLEEIKTSRSMIDTFRGYNHNLRIGENEFYDMENLTSNHYPVLSPRAVRGTAISNITPQAMISKDSLCYIDGTKFVMNEYEVDLGLSEGEKQLVSMGAYVIILPDKRYVNTADLSDYGSIEAAFPATEGQKVAATYEMCNLSGVEYTGAKKSSKPPENPNNMDLWIDTSSVPNSLKQYSATNAVWTQIATTYIKISAPNIAASFKQYDAVKITGLPSDTTQFESLEGQVSPLWAAYHDAGDKAIGREEGTDDYIVVVGFLDEARTVESNLRLERTMPKMDFIVESENRLWGCRYGTDANGNVVNEIYASKLGDFKNWNCFMGLSTDSYAASCGTDGQFTGAITHLGYPIFFKERCMHKVYGNFPSNFQIQTTTCDGVQKGSHKSLAIVNGVLYYKSRSAVCGYDGSLPLELSSALGEISYSDAVACGHAHKYYISMKDTNGAWTLFVYDTKKGLWHKEDNLHIKDFCSCRDELYYIEDGGTAIRTMQGSGTKDTDPIKWMAETGVIGISSPDKKYVTRMNLRLSLNVGTKIQLFVQYDSNDTWEIVYEIVGTRLRTFTIPIRPRRCDHLKLRIVGEGEAKIYSITKTTEQGSDI